jgi:hypothetical protein
VFYLSGLLLLCLLVFVSGVYSGRRQTLPYRMLAKIRNDAQTVLRELPNLAGTKPTHWVEETRYQGDGVTRNDADSASGELILLQGFFDDGLELRLIKRDGTLVVRWPVNYSALASNISHLRNTPASDWNVGLHGAVLLPDGSVVFSMDHIGLFKLDRCGALVWSVDEPTHHSVERNADGSFWVSAANKIDTQANTERALFRPPYAADTLLRVSAEGEVLNEISLVDVFVESNMMGLLTLTGSIVPSTMEGSRPDFERELFHLNDVEELPEDLAPAFPMFSEGDLLVSLRNRNLILVVDRETQRIKWWHIGPWVRQHDPDWSPDGTITVFDNNRDGSGTGEILGSSRIVAIDPTTRQTQIRYGGPGEEFFYAERRGKHQVLQDGGMLIIEAEAGRVFEIDPTRKIRWEYVNRYSATENARITDATVHGVNYFTVGDWNCSE